MSEKLTIRQRLNRSRLNADARMLVEEGITEISGLAGAEVLTDTGRKVLFDILWQDDALRTKVVAAVKDLRKAEKKEKKGE